MNRISKIICEEVHRFLREYDDYDDVSYNLFQEQDELKSEILLDFLYKNDENFTKMIKWVVVPVARLKKIWEDYIKVGVVRDEKGINLIESIMIRNALNLETLTYLSGHSSSNPDEDFEDSWGEYIDDYILRVLPNRYADINQTEIPFDNPNLPHQRKEQPNTQTEINHFYDNVKNIPFETYVTEHENDLNADQMKVDLMEILTDHFYRYYSVDKNGTDIMSDYGTQPLVNLAYELARENNNEKKVVIIDKMLNIVHQRSDLASWFIEGGSSSLSNISGYEIPNDDSSWNRHKSAVSGVYT